MLSVVPLVMAAAASPCCTAYTTFPYSVAVGACGRRLSMEWLPRCLRLNSLWVRTLPGFLLWAGSGAASSAIHLLGGIIKVSVRRKGRCGKFRDESPSRVLLPMLMASTDVTPFLKASWLHFFSRASASPTASITGVASYCAMPM